MLARLGVFENTLHAETANGGLEARLQGAGGYLPQDRLIRDKYKTFRKALWSSYQAADIKKLNEDENIRALINPNKLKFDYDDKILSVANENNFKVGDIFEWSNTGTYWLIYLQDLSERAYFRGNIRRCSYEIQWKMNGEIKRSYIAVRGPVETKLRVAEEHNTVINVPNYTLTFMIPSTEETKEMFVRYNRFMLEGVAWKVAAVDKISNPEVLEVQAVEDFINEFEDSESVIGEHLLPPQDPNDSDSIQGETFIKPKEVHHYSAETDGEWSVDSNCPVELKNVTPTEVDLVWKLTYSGQFKLYHNSDEKTIIVESLF